MTAALSVHGLVAGYAGVPVVRDIDLDIGPDTFLAMVGANGAGKTTTLRAIMGLCDAFAGTVELGGKSLAGARTSDRVIAGLALCPEGRQVFPSLTVEENLLTGAIAGRAEALERVYGLLPRLAERRGQTAGTMSGGEQQQLAVGRSLMSDPRVLLVDEASLGLAPVMVDHVFEILASIHASGTAVVAVEQNIRISAVATEIVVLEQGEISDRIRAGDVGHGLHEAARAAYFGTGDT
jgi:branched-chain amino acid transport system ATP-binding protein